MCNKLNQDIPTLTRQEKRLHPAIKKMLQRWGQEGTLTLTIQSKTFKSADTDIRNSNTSIQTDQQRDNKQVERPY